MSRFAYRSFTFPSLASCTRPQAHLAATLQGHRSATSPLSAGLLVSHAFSTLLLRPILTCPTTYSFPIHLARCTSLHLSGHSDTGHMSTSSGASVTPSEPHELAQRLPISLRERDAARCNRGSNGVPYSCVPRAISHSRTPKNLPAFLSARFPSVPAHAWPHLARHYTCISTCDAWACGLGPGVARSVTPSISSAWDRARALSNGETARDPCPSCADSSGSWAMRFGLAP